MDRYDYMKACIRQAEKAATLNEVPVGCVIVKEGNIISEAHNLTKTKHNPTKHAEILAIEKACKTLQSDNLSNCELYVTLEPCPMCAGAIINSKIKKVVFGAFDLRYGACGSVLNLMNLPDAFKPECYGGIMEDECSLLLTEFFDNLR